MIFVAGVIALRAAAALINPGASTGFEDETAYLFQAKLFASGRLSAAAPREADAFRTSCVVLESGRWYGKYFPGFPLLLSIGVGLGLAAWVNPVLEAATAAAAFLLADRLSGRMAAWVAAAAVLLAPGVLIESSMLLSHPAAHLVLTAAALCVAIGVGAGDRARSTSLRAGPLAVAGLLLAFGFNTRPLTTVALGLPWMVWVAARAVRARRLAVLAAVGLPVLVGAAALPAWNAAMTGHPLVSGYEKIDAADRLGFAMPRSDLPRRLSDTARRLFRFVITETVPLLPLPALAGLVFAVRGRPRASESPGVPGALAALVLGPVLLVLAHVGYHGEALELGARYYHEAVAPLSVVAAIALSRFVGPGSGQAATVAGLLAVVSVPPVALMMPPLRQSLEPTRKVVARVRRAAREAPAGERTLVLVEPGPAAYDLYEVLFPLNEPDLSGPLVVARARTARQDETLAGDLGVNRLLRLDPDRPLSGPGAAPFPSQGPPRTPSP